MIRISVFRQEQIMLSVPRFKRGGKGRPSGRVIKIRAIVLPLKCKKLKAQANNDKNRGLDTECQNHQFFKIESGTFQEPSLKQWTSKRKRDGHQRRIKQPL